MPKRFSKKPASRKSDKKKRGDMTEEQTVAFYQLDPEDRAARRLAAHYETEIQENVVNFLNAALLPPAMFFHVPNEGKRGPKAASDYKKLGGLAGVADLCFIRGGKAHFIEMKVLPWKGARGCGVPSLDGGTWGLTQQAFEALCLSVGAPYRVCRSINEVVAVLEDDWGFEFADYWLDQYGNWMVGTKRGGLPNVRS